VAELPAPRLLFDGTCPDCGRRQIVLPRALPEVGDDFDWRVRDFDSFRAFLLQELAGRFPQRGRWSPADVEVTLIEALAAVLDQFSDTLDRVAAEAFLETARRPASVRRLLEMIGYDAVELARDDGAIAAADGLAPEAERQKLAEGLDALWLRNPHLMDEARRAGPRAIHTQRRMVTTADYAELLEEHPLVERAHAWSSWTGSWATVQVAVVAIGDRILDEDSPDASWPEIASFHGHRDLRLPDRSPAPTIRSVLRPYVEAYRMIGQEVVLRDAVPVALTFSLSIRVSETFFQSEVRQAVHEALGTGPGGFFEPGRLAFGEDVHVSDLIETLMALDGVESVCVNRFKRLGSQFPDQTAAGRITLDGLELAVCDNDPGEPSRGFFRLVLHGGGRG
jgi:hypothetical protein